MAEKAKPKAKVKAKAKVAKKTSSEMLKIKKKKKKVNLNRLYVEMNKHTNDANDKEIVRRFKIIVDSSEEDITKVALDGIIKDPAGVVIHSYHDSLQPYIKHYLYMLKRSAVKK